LAVLYIFPFITLRLDHEFILIPLVAMAIETTEAFIDRCIQKRRSAVVTGEHAKGAAAAMRAGWTIPFQDRAERPFGDIQILSGTPRASGIDASPKASLRTVEQMQA